MSLKIRWIGQSGYLLSNGKNTLCIDPYLSNVVDRVAGRGRMVKAPFTPGELQCDAVICTHDHLDHVDTDAIPDMKKEGMLFLAPTHAEPTLCSCGVTQYQPFDEGTVCRVGEFELTAVYAHHSVPAVGVLVKYDGLTLYFSGDTEYHERLEALADAGIDVMFICINGRLGNMNVQEAVKLTRIIAPRLGVPTHYGMFESNTEDPAKYTSCLKNSFEMEYDKEYSVEEMLKNV